jgi:quercetin dioxygenase-like cupin family protein
MSEGYAAHRRLPNPSFVGFPAESQRGGIEITGRRQHDLAASQRDRERIASRGRSIHMSNATAASSEYKDAFWWQGGLYRIEARAEDTGRALGLVDARIYRGFGPPLHVHRREDEAFYVIEGEIRYRQGEEEFVGGPGAWVWGPRNVPHTFKVTSETARALILVTPGGFEQMFEVGGVPVSESPEPPVQEYDPQEAVAISGQFGFEVIGPQLD